MFNVLAPDGETQNCAGCVSTSLSPVRLVNVDRRSTAMTSAFCLCGGGRTKLIEASAWLFVLMLYASFTSVPRSFLPPSHQIQLFF